MLHASAVAWASGPTFRSRGMLVVTANIVTVISELDTQRLGRDLAWAWPGYELQNEKNDWC